MTTQEPQKCILAYLSAGGRLTVQKAFRLFHTTELRKIVSRLKRKGYIICADKKSDITNDGRLTQFNEYYMLKVADASE